MLVELAERDEARQLGQVHDGEEDRPGGDEDVARQALRDQVDLKWRAALVQNGGGEARHRAQEHADARMGHARRGGLGEEGKCFRHVAPEM